MTSFCYPGDNSSNVGFTEKIPYLDCRHVQFFSFILYKKKLKNSVFLMDKDIWHTTLKVNFLGAGNLPHRFVLSPGIWGHCLGCDSLAIFNVLIKRINGRDKQRKA